MLDWDGRPYRDFVLPWIPMKDETRIAILAYWDTFCLLSLPMLFGAVAGFIIGTVWRLHR
jgi:hypothetical protein